MPEVFIKGKKWDGKKPTSDMNDGDFQKWEVDRRTQCLDDCDFYMDRHRIKFPGVTRKRIWPPPEAERE